MSAELLRRAAALMREQVEAASLSPWLADVADRLDAIADLAPPDPHHADEECETCEQVAAALTVARAYLGEDA